MRKGNSEPGSAYEGVGGDAFGLEAAVQNRSPIGSAASGEDPRIDRHKAPDTRNEEPGGSCADNDETIRKIRCSDIDHLVDHDGFGSSDTVWPDNEETKLF